MKNFTLHWNKVWHGLPALFLFLFLGFQGWGQESVIYSTGFESSDGFTAGTVYNNTTIKYDGASGQQWGTYYGTASTTSPISGSQSMQMRYYTSTPSNYGYTFTNFDLVNVTKVVFNSKNASSATVIVSYSTDGGSTYVGDQEITLTTSSTEYTYNISATGEYANVRLKFSLSATINGARVYIDDVSVYGMVAADTDPPVWTSTYPNASSITTLGFDLNVNLDEACTAYYVVLANGATVPSSTQIKAGTDASDVAAIESNSISVAVASTDYSATISTLSAGTDYDVYVVAEDAVPNIQASPVLVNVTTSATLSTETDITAFSFSEQTGAATIDAVNHTVAIEVFYGTNPIGLVASFALSTGATAKVGETDQTTDVTANDFSSPVTYTIKAQDNTTTQDWVVTVSIQAPSTDATITSTLFSVDNGLETITGMPYNESLSHFEANITPATDATFHTYLGDGNTLATDLQSGYKLICTAQDGSTKKTYSITRDAEPAIDLFFSEYIEGASNNKAIEIYNPTQGDVDLSQYTVKLGVNGAAWSTTLDLSGTLASGDVYVIYNSSAVAAIVAQGDIASTVTYFNGDDALGLFKSGILIDAFGKQGEDPGAAWDVAGVTGATVNHTLVRKAAIHFGNVYWYSSAGTDVSDSEWTVYAQDELSYLGSHTASDIFAPTVAFTPVNGTTQVSSTINPTLTFDEDIYNAADGSAIVNGDLGAKLSFYETATPGNLVNFAATINGKVVTVDPTADLTFGMQYTLKLLANKVEDASGNENAESSTSFTVRNASTDATVTSGVYTVNSTDNTITGVPFSETLAGFESNIVPATGATFDTYLSNGTTVATDLQTGYKLICTAEDGSTKKTYVITVNASLSNAAEILTYSIPQQTGPATIGTNTIGVEVPYGQSVTSLVATFTLSTSATAKVGATTQQSGVTANDFTSPRVYTVTAEDASTKDWTVTVTHPAPNNDATLSDLAIDGTTVSGFVPATLTYSMELPYGTIAVPAVTYALNDVTASASQTDATALPGTTTVTVTAQDGTTQKIYSVEFTLAAASSVATLSSTVYTVDDGAETIKDIPYNATLDAFKANLTPADGATFEVYLADGTTVATDLATGYKVITTAQDGTTHKTYSITLDEAPAMDLFFSEYIEGSSSNKAIEIFNPTSSAIDLSAYTLKQANNGSGWGSISTGEDARYSLTLSGTLASHDVYVIYNGADTAVAISSVGDLALTYSSTANTPEGANLISYNGDDAMGLFKNGTLIDVIGVPTVDPGTAWDVAGVTNATQDHTLVRKSSVIAGDTNWVASAGTTADDAQWIVYPNNTFDYIGSHTVDITDDQSPVAVFSPENGATNVLINSHVTLTFDENVFKATDGSAFTDSEDVSSYLTFTETTTPANTVVFAATISGKVITVTPTAALTNEMQYTITLAADMVQDAAGNKNASSSASFTTVSSTAPIISNVTIQETAPYYAGDDVTVQWSSANVTNVKIEAWVPSQSAWVEMVATTDAVDGNETFTIPADAAYTTTYKIRVSDVDNASVNSESVEFEIRAVTDQLGTLIAMPANSIVRYTGSATVTYTRTSRNQKYIQDASGAVLIDDNTTAPGFITGTYAIGEGISNILGKVTLYSGLIEFVPFETTGEKVTDNHAIEPEVRTIASLTHADQCKLVKLEGFEFANPNQGNTDGTFKSGTNYDVTGVANTVFSYRTAFSEADYIGTKVPTVPVTIIGLVGQYNSLIQFTARNSADIILPLSNVATLSNLTVNEVTVEGFDPATMSYRVELPYGTTAIPAVAGTATDAHANVVATQATTLPGDATVKVTAEDGTTELTYTVQFTLALNIDASLSEIKVDGTAIEGFDAETLVYVVKLPGGTTAVPEVTATATDENASVEVTAATVIPGTSSILVTAEDGIHTMTYEVRFTTDDLSGDATLSDLTVDETTIDGFGAAVYEYTVELSYGTEVIPVVGATATEEHATVEITQATALPGTASIHVLAQDGATELTYSVNFTIAANTDATLSEITVDGTAIDGFDPATLVYVEVLPAGATAIPAVTATATDANAGVTITAATAIPGTTSILVTAADGETTKTYEVRFTTDDLSSDATLSDLTVDEVTITGFDAAVYEYTVVLAYGTTAIPVIGATATDANATVELTQAAELPGDAEVHVMAQDEATELVYTVHFTIAPNNDATLSTLTIDATEVDGFDPATLVYSVELPAGTTTIPVVDGVASDTNAMVSSTQALVLPGDATVVVTAEDNETVKTYTVHFTVAPSTYTVTFNVKDGNARAIDAASVEFNGSTQTTNSNGVAVFTEVLAVNDAAYTVSKSPDYLNFEGTVSVTDHDVTLDVVLQLVGVNDSKLPLAVFYPNPTNGKVTLQLNRELTGSQLVITDVDGRVIEQKTITQMETILDLSGNKQGIYFIKILSGNENYISKLILN